MEELDKNFISYLTNQVRKNDFNNIYIYLFILIIDRA